jgi:Domain of unknown function (DUF4384)
MKKKIKLITNSTLAIFVLTVMSVTGLCAYLEVTVQNQEEERTREAFLFSREKAPTRRAKGAAVKRKRRNPGANTIEPTDTKIGKQTDPASGSAVAIQAIFAPENRETELKEPLAAAYWLFRQAGEDNWVAADSSELFEKGNVLRFVVESAQDSYLYVFNTTNGGSPQMVYPTPNLKNGANRMLAHVPYEIPSRGNPDFSGFELADAGVSEEIWLVVSKIPLSSIPTDKTLITLCRKRQSECPWRPSPSILDNLIDYQKSTVTTNSRPTETASLSGELEKAITRHIRLRPKAKGTEPAVIFRNRSGSDEPLALRISLLVR